MLRDTNTVLKEQGVRLVFANVSGALRGQLDRYGITELIGRDAIYGSVHAVVADYERPSVAPKGNTTEATNGAAPT